MNAPLTKLIPAMDEDGLARAWPVLAAQEGHKGRLPQYKPPYRCPHIENVQRLLNDGLTRVEVSKELGISTTVVSGIVARNNLQWPRKTPARERIDADELRELLTTGKTWNAIADELGEPVSTVRRRAEDLGLRNTVRRARRKDAIKRVDAERLRELLAKDMTWGAVADELGEAVTTVRRLAERLGIKRGA